MPRVNRNKIPRMDGRYLRMGGIVTLLADDGDCLRLFRTSAITHQNLSDEDCRRMLEIIQVDDEVRAAGDRNGNSDDSN